MKPLCDVLDEKSYKKLMRAFGGKRVWVPKCGNLGHHDRDYFASRNGTIKKLWKNGKSVRTLSELSGLSQKRIYNILKNAPVRYTASARSMPFRERAIA